MESSAADLAVQVSVVVPTHRRPRLLERALQSVAAQRQRPFEVIVVHDEPLPDGPWTPPGGLADVTVQRLTTGGGAGVSAARNLGMAAATGTHVAFLDDDDEWDPRFLEACIGALRTDGVDWAVSWMRSVRGDRWRPGRSMPPSLSAADTMVDNLGITGSNFVIRLETLRRIGGFDEDLPVWNDVDLLVRLLRAGIAYAVVTERLVDQHYDHGLSLTAGPGRDEKIPLYLAKWEDHLSSTDRRRAEAEMLSAARHHEPSSVRRLVLRVKVVHRLGLRGIRERLADRRGWEPLDRSPDE